MNIYEVSLKDVGGESLRIYRWPNLGSESLELGCGYTSDMCHLPVDSL